MKQDKKEQPDETDDRRRGDQQVRRALSLLTQLGAAMAACVVAGVFAGKWLDQWLGTSPWLLIVLAFLGAGAAFKVMYELVIKEWL